MANKKCSKCKKTKDISEFNKHGVDKDGNVKYNSQCRECVKEYRLANKEKEKERGRIYREKNKDRIKKWREDNKDIIRELDRNYRLNNAETVSEKRKEYYKKNKEKCSKASKEYYEKNKDEIKQRTKEYYNINKEKIKILKKKYREENCEKIKQKDKKYYELKKKIELENLRKEFNEYIKLNPNYYTNNSSECWTYIIKSDGFWKIGKSTQINIRVRDISKHIPILKIYKIPVDIERMLHLEFDEFRFCHMDTWRGSTELFDIEDSVMRDIIDRERFMEVCD